MLLFYIGLVGQWLSMMSLVAGVGIEVAYQADIGFIVITSSAVLFALGTKARTMAVSNGKYPKDLKHKRQSDWM